MALAWLPELFKVSQQALATNFWGLGCPFYCSGGLGNLVAAFLLGAITGAAFGGWLAWVFLSHYTVRTQPQPAVEAPSAVPASRVLA